jgi:branched-chain amino acid transport system ATP-binding protein
MLTTRSLTKTFGKVTAVDHVDYSIDSGSWKGLIGPNGAGKTTFFDLLSGMVQPSSGEIIFNDKDITKMNPSPRANLGIGRSFQITNLYPDFTVLDNIRMGVLGKKFGVLGTIKRSIRDLNYYNDITEEAHDIVEIIGLREYSDKKAKLLSHGQQRALEIGIMLSQDPKLLLLDEPTAGLAEDMIEKITDILEHTSDHTTAIVIEHRIEFLAEIVDSITVMNKGEIIAEGSIDEIRSNKRIQEVYL